MSALPVMVDFQPLADDKFDVKLQTVDGRILTTIWRDDQVALERFRMKLPAELEAEFRQVVATHAGCEALIAAMRERSLSFQ